MSKSVKIITGFIGFTMFFFGFNKFFDPSKTNLMIQVTQGELPLPSITYWFVIFSEQAIGLTLLFISFFSNRISTKSSDFIFYLTHIGIVIMMIVATYVHLHPNVPGEAVPMGKTPYFPLGYMLIILLNIYLKKSIK